MPLNFHGIPKLNHLPSWKQDPPLLHENSGPDQNAAQWMHPVATDESESANVYKTIF